MNEFIKKNRSLLHSYCISTRFIGWMLLIGAILVPIVQPLSGISANSEHRSFLIYLLCKQVIMGYLLIAIVLLGLAQFIRYLYESEYRPGLILRHGIKVIYIYAIALIASPLLTCYFRMREYGDVDINFELLHVLLHAVPRALIFIGMAKVLKRTMPMIEESKTLV